MHHLCLRSCLNSIGQVKITMDLLAFVQQVVKHAEVASDASSTPLESISKAISTLDKEICEHWLGKDATEKAKVSEWVSFSAGFETVKVRFTFVSKHDETKHYPSLFRKLREKEN